MDNEIGGNKHLIIAFDVLYVVGATLLTFLLIATYLSSKATNSKTRPNSVHRSPIWFIAVGSWIVLSISYCLLLGKQTGPLPSYGICLTQAVLVYSAPTFCAFSAVAFLLQVYLSMSRPRDCPLPALQHLMLYYISFIIPLGVFVESLILGLVNPSIVRRDPGGMYCNFRSQTPKKITGSFIVCALIATLTLEAMITRSYWRAAQASRKASQALAEALDVKVEDYHRQTISCDSLARIVGFTLCVLIAMSCSLAQYLPNSGIDAIVNIVQATLPCSAALIFGTQKDIWKTLWPWSRRARHLIGNRGPMIS